MYAIIIIIIIIIANVLTGLENPSVHVYKKHCCQRRPVNKQLNDKKMENKTL